MDMVEKLGKKVRSRAYPALPLGAAIDAAKQIYDDLGIGPHSREALSRGLGYAGFCGAASPKIGALAQFSLLSRQNGRYSITESARAIFKYPAAGAAANIAQAALCPALYRALAARFAGESLPKNLALLLISDYGIAKKAAPDAAMNFAKTMEFAGLFESGRVVLPENMPSKANVELPSAREGESLDDDTVIDDFENKKTADERREGEKIKVNLDSGITIMFPQKFSSRLALGEFAADLKNLNSKAAFD